MAEYTESNIIPTSPRKKYEVDMNIDEEKQLGVFSKVTQFLLRWGIETHG
jgi:hypothetical protein